MESPRKGKRRAGEGTGQGTPAHQSDMRPPIHREVTERERGEEERLRIANYVRLLLDSTDQGIYGIDMHANCTLVNRAGAEMVGYKPDELLGKNIHKLIHHSRPDGSPYPVDECPIVRAIRIGQGIRVDRDVFWRKDGSSFPVEYSSYPVVEDGVVKGAVVTYVDITERKRMEEALRSARDELESRVRERTAELAEANQQLQIEIAERKRTEEALRQGEERFRSAFDSASIGMALVAPDGRFLRVNRSLCEIVGYSARELLNTTFQAITYPDDLQTDLDYVRRMLSGEIRTYQMEKRYIHKLGHLVWVLLSVSLVYDAQGKPLYFISQIQDITKRKRAEQEREQLLEQLREVNQQLVFTGTQVREQAEVARRRASELEMIIESIADGVFLCDKEGRIIDVNEAGMRLIGLASKQEALRPLADYLGLLQLRHPDGRPISTEELALSRALHGEVVTGYEETASSLLTSRDIYLLVSAAPVRDREGNIAGAVEVMSDITRIRELDKLKDDFIFVAAHELKTPVAIMKGYAQALLRGAEDIPTPRRKMLDSINRGADRIDRIVKDLLDISRLHLGHLELTEERINLPELVEEVVDRMAVTTTKHRVQVVRAEPVVVQGDRDRLEQVLTHLIDNAIKYSPRGGDIDVAVDVRDREAVVSVRDYGVGIPKEKQGHIFERFYSAHTGTPYDYGGMGVGLFISREIVTRHGGRMWFESQEGRGSTFFFSVPLQDELARESIKGSSGS